jgi:hypothetical protein
VTLFTELLAEGVDLPPIEVVRGSEDTFLICDGVHRTHAAGRAGRYEIEVVIIEPHEGESPEDAAFRRALETATTSALPLTNAERRDAAKRLLATRDDLSHREVARLVGVAHSSVDRWATEVADSATKDGPGSVSVTPGQMAFRLVRYLDDLGDSQGLWDLLMPKRMGHYLAEAFYGRFEDRALEHAERMRAWLTVAVDVLEEEID